jgi:3-methyl-2-oxobutanoate hydroxymethyltransferase
MAAETTHTKRVSAPDIAIRKGSGEPLVMVTAYDAPTARIVDAAGVDMILVGDTLAMVVLGYDDTLQVTTDDMAHHVGAVARTSPRSLVVGDLPWLSYHVSTTETVHNAAALVRAGAGAVKLVGGRKRLDAVPALLDAEIPVMGHLGLTPQSVHALGGFRVQGKDLEAARAIVDDAIALADAGCFAIVLECVPDAVARLVTDTVPVPPIGLGAGRHCDGQVHVCHDLLGIEDRIKPKFVRRYAELGADATVAVERFARDVRAGTFPSSKETYHAADLLPDELKVLGPDLVVSRDSRVGTDGSEAQEPAPA